MYQFKSENWEKPCIEFSGKYSKMHKRSIKESAVVRTAGNTIGEFFKIDQRDECLMQVLDLQNT